MAGSYNHIVNKKGKFQGTKHLDHMGDAYEALEECYGMIWWLAQRIDNGAPVTNATWVEMAQQSYREGLEISPGVVKSDE